jgi:hypothetical protein
MKFDWLYDAAETLPLPLGEVKEVGLIQSKIIQL